jgi:pyruvate kinase
MVLKNFTKTKILATLGPASSSVETLEQLVEEGVDVFRLNMSHMNHEEARMVIGRIRKISSRIGILIDLQGPKIRLTSLAEPVQVAPGDTLEICGGEEDSTPALLQIPFAELVTRIEVGQHLLIDDGLVRLRVKERKDANTIVCEAVNQGTIRGRKGVAAPEMRLVPENYLDESDIADIKFGTKIQVDFIAASFVSQKADVERVREEIGPAGSDIHIIAKIESQVGVENIDEIIQTADGIMVARGDLGVEIPPEQVPLVQKRIIQRCNEAAKPVVVATQMLESMVHQPIASRAETSDVANAILDGTDAIMLSAETSIGKYPVKAVRTMATISDYIEREGLISNRRYDRPSQHAVEFVSKAAARSAKELGIKAIVSLTASGFTARNMASFHPRVPIFATTPNRHVIRQLALSYGVYCIQAEHIGRYNVMLYRSLQKLKELSLLEDDDLVAVIGGVPVGKPGSTNLIQVETVGVLMTVE